MHQSGRILLALFALLLGLGMTACDQKRSGGTEKSDKEDKATKPGGRPDDPGVGGEVKGNVDTPLFKTERVLDRINNYLATIKPVPEDEAAAAAAVKEASGGPSGYNWPKKDSWGEAYIYEKTGDDKYKFFSKGPDKTAGTDDDVFPSN